MCDNQTGTTTQVFVDTTGSNLTESAAISHTSSKSTASMPMTAGDAPVMPVIERPEYDPWVTQAYGQRAIHLPRSPVPAAIGGDEATYVASQGLAESKSPADPDLLPNISGDNAEELEPDEPFPRDIR